MKLNNIFTSLVAVCALAIGCTKTYPTDLDNIQLSQSTVGLPSEKVASVTVTVNATEDWAFDETSLSTTSAWLTVAPTSGKAGETKVVFTTKAASAACNKATLTIKCGTNTQYVVVQQGKGASINTAETAFTPDEAIEFYADGKNKGAEVYVKGVVVSAKIDVSYGNAEFYLENSKGISFEFYRCYDFEGEKFTDKEKVQVGDIIVGVGSLTNYNTTVELGEGCKLVSITKSLVKVCNDGALKDIEKEGADVEMKVIAKGGDLRIKTMNPADSLELDWVSVKSIDLKKAVKSSDPDTTVVKVHVAESEEDVRSGIVSFSSGTSTIDVVVSQKSGLAAYPLPFNYAFESSFGAFEVVDIENPDQVTIFNIDSQYKVAKASAYISSVNHPAKVALTSPNIDLNKATAASLTFEHAYRYGANKYEEMTLEVTKDNGATWTPVLIPDYGIADKYYTMAKNTVSLTPYVGNIIMFRFVYTSTAANCSTWEIKGVSVTADEVISTNIAQIQSLAKTAEGPFTANLDSAIVSYVSGNNVFLQDKTGGVQLYSSNHGLKEGDVLKGEVSGKIKLYAGYPELTAIDCSKATKSTATVVPVSLSFAQLKASYLRYQNCRVLVDGPVTLNATMSPTVRDGKFTQGDIEFNARLQVKTVTIEAGTGTLTCFPARYNETLQLNLFAADNFVVTK